MRPVRRARSGRADAVRGCGRPATSPPTSSCASAAPTPPSGSSSGVRRLRRAGPPRRGASGRGPSSSSGSAAGPPTLDPDAPRADRRARQHASSSSSTTRTCVGPRPAWTAAATRPPSSRTRWRRPLQRIGGVAHPPGPGRPRRSHADGRDPMRAAQGRRRRRRSAARSASACCTSTAARTSPSVDLDGPADAVAAVAAPTFGF